MHRLTIVAAPVLSHGGGIRHVAAVARAAGNVGWTVDVRVARRSGCPPVTPLIRSAAPAARVAESEAGDLMGMARTIGWCLAAAGSSGGVVYAALPQTVLAAHRFGLRRDDRPRTR